MSNTAQGLDQTLKALRQFPQNIQKNVMVGAIRAGCKPIVQEAKNLVPVKSGFLKKSIKIRKRRTARETPYKLHFTVSAGNYVKGFGAKASHAHLVEFGFVQADSKGGKHVPAHPFMRPALEREATHSIDFVRDYIAKRIPKEIEKARR